MPRHEIDVPIGTDGGRDAGKTFHLKEMDAFQAESWTHRVLIFLANAGIDLLDLIGLDFKDPVQANTLMAMFFGALRNVNYNEARPLLNEMMGCVQVKPDPIRTPLLIRPMTGQDDIEEMGTINKLRAEVFKLHLDFWQSAVPSKNTSSGTPAPPPN